MRLVIVGEGLRRARIGEVDYQTFPYQVVAGSLAQRLEERRTRVDVSVLPQVQAEAHGREFRDHGLGIRKALRRPHQRAGVGVGLPAGLEAEHVARHAAVPKGTGELQNLLFVSLGMGPVFLTQPPQRRQATAAGEQVVPLDGLARSRPGEDEHVHARTIARQVEHHLRRSRRLARCGLRRQTRHVYEGHARRIDVHAVPTRAHVERHGSVTSAGLPHDLGRHRQPLAQALLIESPRVQAEPVDVPVGLVAWQVHHRA